MRNNFQLKTKDERFMKLALQEAAKADHQVFPNPKVGAIVVHDDNIISRGYHQKYLYGIISRDIQGDLLRK